MKQSPTVLITGGAGFIGSHVTEQFVQAGWKVVVLDNLSKGKIENLPDTEEVSVVVHDVLNLQSYTPKTIPHVVLHLAAEASVERSWNRQRFCHDANLTGTIETMEFCRRYRVPRLVVASSAAVYGTNPELPTKETASCKPISPYGLQKLVSEQYAHLFAKRDGYSAVALRLFNVFGPRQLPDSPYSGVISRFLNAFVTDGDITVFGDGLQTRDFVYVKDVAKAFFLAATQPLPAGECWVGNVGTGQASSLLDLLTVMRREFSDWKGSVTHGPARDGDIRHSVSDNSRLREILKWAPDWSFESGLQDYFQSVHSWTL